MDANSTIGFGMFGYGSMAMAHLEALRDIPGARAIAVCGPRLERARVIAARFGVQVAMTEPEEMFTQPDVDAVIVDTPNDAHYGLVLAAARHNKHVFCEKPLATDILQAREMAAAIARVGVRSMMGFSTRFSPLIRRIKQLVDGGAIGQVFHVHAHAFTRAGLLAARPHWSWRTDKARAGTGILGDLGSHIIDLNHFLLSPTSEVMASLKTFIPMLYDPHTGEAHRHEVDDDTALLLRFANGTHGTLALSRVGTVGMDSPIGRRHYLLDGSKGGILWEDGIATLYPHGGTPSSIEGEPPLWQVDHDTFIAAWAHQNLEPFVEAIRHGRDQAPTLHDGLMAQEVMHAAERASASGRWERVGALS